MHTIVTFIRRYETVIFLYASIGSIVMGMIMWYRDYRPIIPVIVITSAVIAGYCLGVISLILHHNQQRKELARELAHWEHLSSELQAKLDQISTDTLDSSKQ